MRSEHQSQPKNLHRHSGERKGSPDSARMEEHYRGKH